MIEEEVESYWSLELEELRLLDSIMLDLLSKKIKKKYKADVYYLRLSLLKLIMQSNDSNNKYLIFKKQDVEEEIVFEFYKLVLNHFYQHQEYLEVHKDINYIAQATSFNKTNLEEYFKRKNSDAQF